MCGFVGIIDPDNAYSLEDLKTANARLKHRGPDDEGYWRDDIVGLAHSRLSIVDLSSAGHQPMLSHDQRYVIAYNGEIYNFEDIRKDLPSKKWRGNSDTEVILEAISEWGIETAIRRFVGMFAFAVYDRYEKQLYLARDRLGIKPLYYGRCRNSVVFGSELSALEVFPHFDSTLDRNALAAFFRVNYVPGPHSIYKAFKKLTPGCFVRIPCDPSSLTLDHDVTQYWSLCEQHLSPCNSIVEAEDRLLVLLKDAISIRMLADVPLGAFLSGGVDSSLVCALMQEASTSPIRTFTIGFENRDFDESDHAKKVAAYIGSKHTDFRVSAKDMLDAVDVLPEICDEPFADASIIPTYLLSRMTRSDVTVALSGDGGDELFWGYDRYRQCASLWSMMSSIPRPLRLLFADTLKSRAAQSLASGLGAPAWTGKDGALSARLSGLAEKLTATDQDALYRQLRSHWKQPSDLVLGGTEPPSIYDTSFDWLDNLPAWRRMSVRDTLEYLPDDILTKVDRASMAVSLEARVPILDHRIVEFSYSLTKNVVCPKNEGKVLLRNLLARYVPASITDRPKKGFGVPMAEWLRGPLKEWMLDLLSEHTLRRQGNLDSALVGEKVEMFLAGKHDWSGYIWDILMFQSWLAKRSR